MTEHFVVDLFISIAIIVMVLGPVTLEAYANKINPWPKMKDPKNEERWFGVTICKTREMFSVVKR